MIKSVINSAINSVRCSLRLPWFSTAWLWRAWLWTAWVLLAAAVVEWGRHDGWLGASTVVTGSLPSFVWMLAAGTLAAIWVPERYRPRLWLALLVVSVLLEWLSETLSPAATFDVFDVLALLAAMPLLLLAHAFNALPKAHFHTPVARLSLFPLFALQLACTQCVDCYCGDEGDCDTLVYLSSSEIRADISPEYGNTATLQLTGKLYVLDGWLAVVDRWRGIHIFDVSDPQNPTRQVYLPVPGVTDISIKDDVMYVNAFTDLVAIDLASLQQGLYEPGSETRYFNVFTYVAPDEFTDDADLDIGEYVWGVSTLPDEGVVIGYQTDKGRLRLYGQWQEQP